MREIHRNTDSMRDRQRVNEGEIERQRDNRDRWTDREKGGYREQQGRD